MRYSLRWNNRTNCITIQHWFYCFVESRKKIAAEICNPLNIMYRILIISIYSTIFPFLTNYSVISEFLNEYCLTYYEQYLIQTNKYLWLPVAYFIVFSLHFRYCCILMKLKQSIQYIYIYCNGVLIKLWLTDWSWMFVRNKWSWPDVLFVIVFLHVIICGKT
jgi:hypothetical protein